MIRELIDGDYEKLQRAIYWPLHEVLFAYELLAKDSAVEAYKHKLLIWVTARSTKRPPPVPEILKAEIEEDGGS